MAHNLLFAMTLAFDQNLENVEANHNVNTSVSSCDATISIYHATVTDSHPVLTSSTLLMALKKLSYLQR